MEFDVLIAARRNGSPNTNINNNVFKNSTEVTVTAGTAGAGMTATIADSVITLPGNWQAQGTNYLSPETITAVVTLPAKPTSGTADFQFNFSGVNNAGGPVTGTNTVTVNWTTGACASPNTPPTVSVTGVTDGATYELGAVPTAGCSVEDAEDGNSTFDATLSAVTGPLAAYGIGSQTAECTYTDAGGLSGSASATYTIVDTTDPTITWVSTAPGPNGNGWNNSDVTVTWSCSDLGGVVASTVTDVVSTDGANQSATGTCTDLSGNSASATEDGINVDKTAPTVSLVDGPADGATYYFGFVPAAPTCSASDATSGLDGSCTVDGYSTALGTHTVTATVSDLAGNSASDSSTYTVLAWTLNGFYAPIDKGIHNTVKNGATVPLKFEVFAGSTELTDKAVVKSFTTVKIGCTTGTPEDVVEEIASTGGTSLRYDTTGGQFIQNWQTPKTPNTCYRAILTTQDGSVITADFKLK